MPTAPTPAAPVRPRSVILTLYGAFLRDLGGWVAIADLIALMRALDVDAQAVRSSISRLKRRGALVAERRAGVVGYALSAEALAIFAEGDRRIYGRMGRARLEDGWVLAVFSVPESEREQRHVLRSRLSWLGFGNAAAGVWVAPAHLQDDTRAALRRLGLEHYVHLFHADYLGFAESRAAVGQWWDLPALQSMYDDFTREHQAVLARWSSGSGGHDGDDLDNDDVDDEAAFRDYVRALTTWRRLPYLDPGLPNEVLPQPWSGALAAEVFGQLTERLAAPALRHVQDVTGLAVQRRTA